MDADAAGWRQMWRLEITAGLSGALTILSLSLGVVVLVVVVGLAGTLHPELGRADALEVLAVALVSIPVTLVLHEAVHGLAFLAFGGRPRFGARVRAGMPYFYAACPGRRFARNPFLVVGLAPLVVLDLAGLALMLAAGTAPFGGAVVVLNTAGAVGDLWMTMVLLQVPSWVHVEDSGLGFLAWAPPAHGEEADRRRPPTGLDVPVLRWVGPWLLATMLAGTPSTFVLLSLAARRPGTQIRVGPMVLARSFEHGAVFSLSGALLLSAVVGAVVVLMAAAGRRLWRRTRRP